MLSDLPISYEPLIGRTVVLEPLEPAHTPGLIEAALADHSIFEFMGSVFLHSEAEVRDYVQESIERSRSGQHLPYAIVETSSGKAVGCTRYLHIHIKHLRCEIGWTWLTPRLAESKVHHESKLLLLDHAFERCGMLRVELRADVFDEAAQRIFERIGADREGVLRSHRFRRDGSRRDTVVYAVIAEDWPELRSQLTYFDEVAPSPS